MVETFLKSPIKYFGEYSKRFWLQSRGDNAVGMCDDQCVVGVCMSS